MTKNFLQFNASLHSSTHRSGMFSDFPERWGSSARRRHQRIDEEGRLLKEIAPSMTRVAVLRGPSRSYHNVRHRAVRRNPGYGAVAQGRLKGFYDREGG
jgi:hypothetical protein